MSEDTYPQSPPGTRSLGAISERASFAFVLFVWLACLIAAQVYIAACASRTPLADDAALFYNRAIGLTYWEYLWAQHNEHSLPLPKLLQVVLYDWTGDIRSGMYLQALVYGAIALACIFAARWLRGGSRPWDVFFPLVWLQLGNGLNLMMGFQIGLAVPGACICTVLICGVLSERRLWPSRALASGLAVVALPLSGGAGLLQMPLLAAYSAWLGFTQRKHPQVRERRGAWIHMAAGLIAVAFGGLYLLTYHAPSGAEFAPGEDFPRWKLALAILCAPFGPDYFDWRPILMPAVGLVALLFALRFAQRGLPARDPRTLGTLAVLGTSALLVTAIAMGRAPERPVIVAARYIPLPAPFFIALTLGGLALLRPRWRELALVAACVLMLFALPSSISYGLQHGRVRVQLDRELDRLVETHADWSDVEQYYTKYYDSGSADIGTRLLRYYAAQGLAPFDHQPRSDRATQVYATFDSAPSEVRSLEDPVFRVLDGELVCLAAPPTAFVFAITPENHAFSCQTGVPDVLLRWGQHPGVRAQVVLEPAGQAPRVLGEIALDPQKNPTQRGLQRFDFSWPAGSSGTLRLIFMRIPRAEGKVAADRVAVRKARVE